MKNFLQKMKGNYPHNSREKTFLRPVLYFGTVFLVLFFLKGQIGTIAQVITAPLYAVRHYIDSSSATVPVFVRSRFDLLSQIQALEEEVAAQKGRDVTLEYLTQENTELREMVHASTTPKILAGIIARPPFTPYDTVIIDKGSNDGIVQFAPVYHGKGVAIGYVRTVSETSAQITLFSSPGVQATVYVFGPNIFTTAYGEGGGVVRLSIPQGITIKENDVVVLPTQDGGALGTINLVQSIPTEPEQHAYMTLPVPINSIRLVSVGMRPIESTTFEQAMVEVAEEASALFTIEVPEDATHEHGTTSTSSKPL